MKVTVKKEGDCLLQDGTLCRVHPSTIQLPLNPHIKRVCQKITNLVLRPQQSGCLQGAVADPLLQTPKQQC